MEDADAWGSKLDQHSKPAMAEDLSVGKFVAEAREGAYGQTKYRSSLEQATSVELKPAGTAASEKFRSIFSSWAKD